jgi:hypothetical protein
MGTLINSITNANTYFSNLENYSSLTAQKHVYQLKTSKNVQIFQENANINDFMFFTKKSN